MDEAFTSIGRHSPPPQPPPVRIERPAIRHPRPGLALADVLIVVLVLAPALILMIAR